MKITVITACYNAEATIETALESVLRQKYARIEYLVIDGGSTDGTVERIRAYAPKFGGRLRWVSERDRGMYDAINKGIRMATGEVVGLLNADDVLSADDVVERVARTFGMEESLTEAQSVQSRDGAAKRGNREGSFAHSCASALVATGHQRMDTGNSANERSHSRTNELLLDVLYGDIRFVANRTDADLEHLREERTIRYYSARHWRPWMLQWGFMPPHPSVYIRRDCFRRLGDYALDYKIAADYALLIRFLRKANVQRRYEPMCFVDMRVGGMSTRSWRSNLLLNQEIVRGNREAGYFCCLPMLLPKYAFKVLECVIPMMKRAIGRKQ